MTDFSQLGLMDLVPALSPEHQSPFHLRDWVEILEEAATPGELAYPLRALCDIPIRHYKTETTLHGIVRILLRDPTRRIIFLTHSLVAAQKRGKRIRELATEAGVGPTRGYDTIEDWSNDKGGGVVVMSAAQSRLGLDCHVLIVDDPLDENTAEDPAVRDAVDATIVHYTARCIRRGRPGPVIMVMSRWHPDDPVGRRLTRTAVKWRYVHQPAVLDEGLETERAFAPNVVSLEQLHLIRAELAEADPTERLWWAQFMGEPRPMGSDMFGPATYYEELPTWGSFRIGHGIDMAFSLEDGSDFFARVSGRVYGPRLYLTNVVRHKLDTPLVEETLRQDLETLGWAPFFSYMSGPEIGTAKLLRQGGIPIAVMRARYNKLVRAQRTIKRWNNHDILVPVKAPWAKPFVRRTLAFRGHEKGRNDDEQDALVSLADGIMGASVGARVKTLGRSYPGMASYS